ncbi:hypothetical protein ACHAWF_003627, partial [Thalassiosira exigua]
SACHPATCENWYRLGAPYWTDYDPDLPLTCTDRSQFEPEFEGLTYPAVVYGCTSGHVLPSPPKGVYQAFTRKCTRADHDKSEKFVCYEMADKTNFQPFVVEAQGGNFDPCDENDTPDVLSFTYQSALIRQNSTYTDGHTWGNITTEFVRERGLEMMLSNLTIIEPAPTQSPTQPPTFKSDASAMQNPGAAMILGLLSFLCLFL